METLLTIVVLSLMGLVAFFMHGLISQKENREHNNPRLFIIQALKYYGRDDDFIAFCKESYLYNHRKDFLQQDWTDFVGMCKAYFSPGDCGVSCEDIIDAVHKRYGKGKN